MPNPKRSAAVVLLVCTNWGCNVLSGIEGFGVADGTAETEDPDAVAEVDSTTSEKQDTSSEDTAVLDTAAPDDVGAAEPLDAISSDSSAIDSTTIDSETIDALDAAKDTSTPPPDTSTTDTKPDITTAPDTGVADTKPPPDTTIPDTTPIDTGSFCTGKVDGTLCALSPRATCRGGLCLLSYCGDGIPDPGEECDDGAYVPGDGCEADCTFSCGSTLKPKPCGSFCFPASCSTLHVCTPGTPKSCTASDACHKSTCDDSSSSCKSTLIDGDGDGHAASSLGVCGDDCDDSDANVFKGQTSWFTSPRASGGYDYDCNGVEELQYPSPGGCDDSSGFCVYTPGFKSAVATPVCGASAGFVSGCDSLCTKIVSSSGTVVQGCH